jgi:hypothetical protein
MGAAGGLVLGLVLAVLVELRDATYRTASDVQQVLDLPVLALVPFVASEIDHRRTRRRRMLVSAVVILFTIAGGYGIWTLKLWRHIS